MAATRSSADSGPAPEEPGPSSSLGDRVYRTLRYEIVFLELPPGAPVREVEVASRLGVGRTPVREALQRLAMNYLVELLPGRGAFVTPISLPDLVKIAEIRVNLEGFAAASAAIGTNTNTPTRNRWKNVLGSSRTSGRTGGAWLLAGPAAPAPAGSSAGRTMSGEVVIMLLGGGAGGPGGIRCGCHRPS